MLHRHEHLHLGGKRREGEAKGGKGRGKEGRGGERRGAITLRTHEQLKTRERKARYPASPGLLLRIGIHGAWRGTRTVSPRLERPCEGDMAVADGYTVLEVKELT